MARVIKAGVGQKPARAQARVVLEGGKKVVGRELYQAKQDAEHILMRAEQERQQRLAEGKKRAAQAREEAMTQGASEAFAAAAAEALSAFRRRAERYAEAAEDIRALALEVVKKVLGTEPDLGPKDIDVILSRGLAQLRARRRLRLQVSAARLARLSFERPNLMKALISEPDLVIEAADDVSDGFARVVTEVGGALCDEATALDALASAVNVREAPRTMPVATAVPTEREPRGPTTAQQARSRGLNVSDLPSARVEDIEEGVDEESAQQNDEEGDETGEIRPRADARLDPRFARGEDRERTIDLRQEKRAPRNDLSDEDIPEIEAHEEDSRTEHRPHAVTAMRPPSRPMTRVVPLTDPPPRRRPDEDLDLFTDDAVPPKKKR
jgi:flagellar biosynthesis/type III secretory pathway protein FliH